MIGLQNAVSVDTSSKEEWLKERLKDVTSTDIAALLNVSPFPNKTEFSVWTEKKTGVSIPVEVNEAMELGLHFEDSIASWICKKYGLTVERMPYMRLPALRMGASFDFKITGASPDSPYYADFMEKGCGILEIKRVKWGTYKDHWSETEAPAHIELQVQHQMVVSGLEWAIIGGMVEYDKCHLIKRDVLHNVQAGIIDKIKSFWKSIDENTPPEYDYLKDAEILTILNSKAGGDYFNASEDEKVKELVNEYQFYRAREKESAAEAEAAKLRVWEIIGTSDRVDSDMWTINTSRTKDAEDEFLEITENHIGQKIKIKSARKGYRQFKVTLRK